MAVRYNKCPNPRLGLDGVTTTGYSLSTTVAAGSNSPATNGIPTTATTSLLCPINFEGDNTQSITGRTFTVGGWFRRTTTAGAASSGTIQIQISFINATGGTVSTINSASLSVSTNGTFLQFTQTAPTNSTGFRLRVPFNSGYLVVTSAVMYQEGSAFDGDFFDGQYPNATWDGTPGLSSSTMSDVTAKTGSDSSTFTDDSGNWPLAEIPRTDDFTFADDSGNFPFAIIDRPDDPFVFTDSSGAFPFVTIDRSDAFTFDDSGPYTIDQLLFAEGTDAFQLATETWSAFVTVEREDSSALGESQDVNAAVPRSDEFTFDEKPIYVAHTGLSDQFSFGESFYIDVISSDTFLFKDDYAGETYAWLELDDEPIVFTDQIKRLRNAPPVYVDQIQYPSVTAISRKPFRVLAQNIFTKEWISNDLPLSDPQLTYRVSGSHVFKSVLNSEVKSVMDLTPGLEPGATWLHVEEAEAIRQSTILLPFIDSNGEQRRTIEGEGFSSYLHQLYYTGPEWKQVQIGPADIIRYLWAHAQEKKSLGVIVSPNVKTPVRLGTEPKDVEFETGEGEDVSFEAGPYDLNWWEVTNLGSENEKLCKETPIEFYERSQWNSNKTDVIHYLDLGYPRVGRSRDDLIIREGENLKELIPEYAEQQGNYPSSVIIVGAGEGPTAIRGFASQNTGRIPYEVVLENQDITSKARADAIAVFELNRRTKSRYAIRRVVIDCTHINSLWGSFMAGDDIKVEGTVRYVGKISDFNRITEFTYMPRTRTADCSVSPSSAFSYGAIPEVD